MKNRINKIKEETRNKIVVAQFVIGKLVMTALVIAIIVYFVAGKFDSWKNKSKHESEITITQVERKLDSIEELATYKETYTDVFEKEEYRKALGVRLPFTKNSVKITYHGVIKVGYEMKDINVRVDNDKKIIYVELPEIGVLRNNIDLNETICVEHNNILNPISTADLFEYTSEIEEKELEEAKENGLFIKGEEHMKMIIDNVLSEFGYEVIYT